MKYKNIFISACVLTAAITAVQAQTNYEWTGGATGDWKDRTNWTPNVPSGQVIGSGSGVDTVHDRVTIDGAYTVTRTGDVYFRTQSTSDPRKGTFDVITLANGAKLDISGLLTVTSSSGGYFRNVLIDKNSTLSAGEIRTGTQNSSNVKSTWIIEGTVIAGNFAGAQGSSKSTSAGSGYILKIDGGSLTVTDTFVWGLAVNPANLNRVGEIHISNGGIVNVGTMDSDWTAMGGNFVNFVDGSGSLKFGYDNWDLSGVQSLINNSYIRKGAAVQGDLQVVDAGDGWLVSVTQVPEASTTVALAAAAAFGVAVAGRALRRRKLVG